MIVSLHKQESNESKWVMRNFTKAAFTVRSLVARIFFFHVCLLLVSTNSLFSFAKQVESLQKAMVSFSNFRSTSVIAVHVAKTMFL